jgi:hypothetical protein
MQFGMTYQAAYLTHLLKLTEESGFQVTLAMVVGLERLENFVETLIEERPEIVQRPKVLHAFANVSHVVMVRLNDARTIKLR